MPEPNVESIRDQIELLKGEIAEIESHIPKWDANSTHGGNYSDKRDALYSRQNVLRY